MDTKTAIQPFEPKDIDQAERLSKTLASSALLPEGLRGKPGDVLVTIITGHELGLSPMQAIRGMHVIKGKAIMSADLAVALVKRHPECLYFKLVKSDDKVATYATERKGEGKTEMSFTIQQAQQAQLGGDNWRKYPAAMLRARCSLALARAVYPDLMLGVYDPDEVPSEPPARLHVAPPPSQPKTVSAAPTVEQARKDAGAITSGEMSAVPPPPVEPEDAEFTEVAKGADITPAEQAIILIGEAGTLAELQALTEKITALGVAKDKAVRDAYGKRQSELRNGNAA